MTGRLLLLLLLLGCGASAVPCQGAADLVSKLACTPEETKAKLALDSPGRYTSSTTTTTTARSVAKGAKQRAKSQVAVSSHANVAKAHKDKKSAAAKADAGNSVASVKGKSSADSRQHKAFLVNYPAQQQVYQGKESKAVASPSTSAARRKQQQQEQKKKKSSGVKRRQQKPESDIYFIRLPPAPYSYVPGLGYISQPPSFSAASLAGGGPRRQRPQPKPQRIRPAAEPPFIKLPIDFVSNGKPTAVYRWPRPTTTAEPHRHGPDSPVIRLNRGPYVFDGRPSSLYLMKQPPAVGPNLH